MGQKIKKETRGSKKNKRKLQNEEEERTVRGQRGGPKGGSTALTLERSDRIWHYRRRCVKGGIRGCRDGGKGRR